MKETDAPSVFVSLAFRSAPLLSEIGVKRAAHVLGLFDACFLAELLESCDLVAGDGVGLPI